MNAFSFRMHRRHWLLGAAAAWAWPGAQAQAGAGQLTVAVAGRFDDPLRHLPLVVAQGLGYFGQENQALQLQDHGSDAQALQAVAEGSADLAAVDFEQMFIGLVPGLRAVALQTRTPQRALAVSLRALPRYRHGGDLQGRRIGVEALGGLGHAMAHRALEQAGVDVAGVNFLAVGQGARAQAALHSGRVHALCHGEAVLARPQRQGEVRIVADARSLDAAQALWGGPVPGICLLAPEKMVQGPSAVHVQALVHGVVHALKWLRTAQPTDIVKLAPPQGLLAERSLYFAALARVRESISPDGTVPEAGLSTALRALQAVNPVLAGRKLDKAESARSLAPEFVRAARQKFGL